MVMATARRVLTSRVDAEEAFQATMFTLAKASKKLRQKAAVAGWLHKTAYSCAIEVHRANARRQKLTERVKERALVSSRRVETGATKDSSDTASHAELKEILDEELARLPQNLRAAIVLCDLEGLTQQQAAKQLGIPASTVNDRVAKGRRMLRGRLIRRGVSLTVAGLASCVASSSVASSVITDAVIDAVTTKAVLFAAGNSAAQIGVSSTITSTATKVISTMTIAKITAVTLGALAAAAFMAPVAAIVGVSQPTASAQPLHYWRFEDSPGFLQDSVAGATLTAQNIVQTALPSNGRGASFPTNIPGIGANASAADSLRSTAGLTTNNSTPVGEAFTIELFANLDDVGPANTNRRAVMAVQALSPNAASEFSWAFAVEMQGTNFGGTTSSPQELELFASDGNRIELIPSGIFIERNTDYFLSASLDVNADVRFYVQDMATGAVQTTNVAHSLATLNQEAIMKIVSPTEFGFVDGILDEVRLSRGVLPIDGLLVNLQAPVPEPATAAIVLPIFAAALAGAVWQSRFSSSR
jgi:RNA polymerase sigma factor (sigma-70 family)